MIGDYGAAGSPGESQVARLVASLLPDVILTTGDNNYPSGAAATLDENVGRFYHSFIQGYCGKYGAGASRNRFFPTLGNHDWGNKPRHPKGADPYLRWFDLPGNERYYDFVRGPVHFFALDSDRNEPDGVDASSAQARWLRDGLAKSQAPWKVVYFHHPPYTSGAKHGPCKWMRWPFAEWGADVVLAGHEHSYERLLVPAGEDRPEIPFIVIGASGARLSGFVRAKAISPFSMVRISEWGALLMSASPDRLEIEFYTADGGSEQPADVVSLLARR
ncbi:MAG: metallophosphoesterase [bacterium]